MYASRFLFCLSACFLWSVSLTALSKSHPNTQISHLLCGPLAADTFRKAIIAMGESSPHVCVRFKEVQSYPINSPSLSFCEPFWPLTSYARTAMQFSPPESLSLQAGRCHTSSREVAAYLRRHLPPFMQEWVTKNKPPEKAEQVIHEYPFSILQLFQVLLLRYLKNELCFSTSDFKDSKEFTDSSKNIQCLLFAGVLKLMLHTSLAACLWI